MDTQALEKAAEHYRKALKPADAAEVDFFEKLYQLVASRADELGAPRAAKAGDTFAPAHPDAAELERMYWVGEPELATHPILVDADALTTTLERTAGLVASHKGLPKSAADALRSFDWAAFVAAGDPVAMVNRPQTMFESKVEADVDEEAADAAADAFHTAMAFAVRAHLDAVSTAYRNAFDPRESTTKADNPLACPVCGSASTLSLVGPMAGTDGNGRMLYCATCGATWPFERIRCARCGSQDQSKLHYTNIAGDTAHRVQTCEACGEHSRVVFQPDLEVAPSLEMEDVVTARMELVARTL